MERTVVWQGIDEWRGEATSVELSDDRLRATGTQIGAGSRPYRLDYELETGAGFVTERFALVASGDGWRRSLTLTRDEDGWSDKAIGAEALDCDLGFSPLTNLMPVLRHHLHRSPGSHDIVVAWVAVPELTVHAARQRYEHIAGGEEPRVRFRSLDGEFEGFTAELELDGDGLIRRYPELAERA